MGIENRFIKACFSRSRLKFLFATPVIHLGYLNIRFACYCMITLILKRRMLYLFNTQSIVASINYVRLSILQKNQCLVHERQRTNVCLNKPNHDWLRLWHLSGAMPLSDIASGKLGNKSQRQLNTTIEENEFENVVWIWSRPQCVDEVLACACAFLYQVHHNDYALGSPSHTFGD